MIVKIITNDRIEEVEVAIPPDQEEAAIARISSYVKKIKSSNIKAKVMGLHQKMTDAYWRWFSKRFGYNPKLNGAEMKAMKEITQYFLSQDQNEENCVSAWEGLLGSFDYWDPFHQKQTKITQISYNLQNIINNVRQYTSAGQRALDYLSGEDDN